MNEHAVLLELDHVTKQFDSPEGAGPLAVLKDVSLRVAAGERLAVVGVSGSGKSTLLNLIGALDRPTSGRVLLEGRDLASLPERGLAAVRNRRIGFVFQLHHLLPQCTALENVLVPTLAGGGGAGAADAEARARGLLERVGLGSHLAHRPGQLSGGECQRVAVARALINRPALLLADEPTGSLDRASAESLAQLLVNLNREEGVALIVVTHAEALAARMGRVLELRDGTLRERGGAA
jgi:predicted ABC-type transport system involved in lysophospholipase L1 biosynthesis ATPase subunit